MQPLPSGRGRGTRLAVVALGLLALLTIVAFASRTGFGQSSQARPTPGYVSYAVSVFLVLFVLAIPFAVYAFLLQARERQVAPRSLKSRIVSNIRAFLVFALLAFVVDYLRRHHSQLFNLGGLTMQQAGKGLHRPGGRNAATYRPTFEWSVFWIALAILITAGAVFLVHWRRARERRIAVGFDDRTTVAEDVAASIGEAIDDLEAEPDARRAVIAAYARMERALARAGLRRHQSDTPVEYLRRILLGLTTRGDAVGRLTVLFERAKFSRHEIDSTMKQDAIAALREIRDDLTESIA
ncbi:MAG TPA: DUF4129 domain-containing protein [Gaiellaceae bacterium]|nr:DUF4129 domain-containing protein [Gaiellaceae bacterium]